MRPDDREGLLIGFSDFPRLLRSGACFVDKGRSIRTILESAGNCLTTGFGKTLTLSMLAAFPELNPAAPDERTAALKLFSGLGAPLRPRLPWQELPDALTEPFAQKKNPGGVMPSGAFRFPHRPPASRSPVRRHEAASSLREERRDASNRSVRSEASLH